MTEPEWSIVTKESDNGLDYSTIQFVNPEGMIMYEVDLSDLHRLVYKWRNMHGTDGRAKAIFEMCADDLESVITDSND